MLSANQCQSLTDDINIIALLIDHARITVASKRNSPLCSTYVVKFKTYRDTTFHALQSRRESTDSDNETNSNNLVISCGFFTYSRNLKENKHLSENRQVIEAQWCKGRIRKTCQITSEESTIISFQYKLS